MSYAALMVYVDVDGIPEQRVRIASELAAKFDAALIGFSARAVPPPFVAEDAIIELTTDADIKQMHKALAKRGNWFRRIVGTDRQDIEWRTGRAAPAGSWRVSTRGVRFEFRKPVMHFGAFVNCP